MNIENFKDYEILERERVPHKNLTIRRYGAANYTRKHVSPQLKLAYLLHRIDPLTDDIVVVSGQWDIVPGGRTMLIKQDLNLTLTKSHFVFVAVYRITTSDIRITDRNIHSSDEALELAINNHYKERDKILSSLESDNYHSPVRSLFHINDKKKRSVYVVVRGTGPIDGAHHNGKTLQESFRAYDNEFPVYTLNGSAIQHLPVAIVPHFYSEVVEHTDRRDCLEIEGEFMTKPFGSKGYIIATAMHTEKKYSEFRKEIDDGFSYEKSLSKDNEYNAIYQPYSGWVPSDLSDVLFETDTFSMIKVDKEPVHIFSPDFGSRLLHRLFHFRGAVSLLYDNKKYSVPPGTYFMKPADLDLNKITMFEYDAKIQEIVPRITLLANSSRSQAITSNADNSEVTMVTTITPRSLSSVGNGDSGFIPRPTKRRLH